MKFLNLIILLLAGITVWGQCGLNNQSVLIRDFNNVSSDTTHVSILVSGAIHNDLNTATQGLCGVQLKFKHPFMKELFIELISPSGQKITLVGGDIVATNTQFINWDVTFVECASVPVTDPGFSAVWENNQLWQIFSNYTGQYYPHLGCLENFNTGPVNGTWTLRCIDFEDEGQGTLLDAKLIFCQDEGINCGLCKLAPGDIQNVDILTCQNDPALDIVINKTFPSNVLDTSVYYYDNVVFSLDTIESYGNTDLSGYAAGTYKICPIQVAKAQKSILPAVNAPFNEATLQNYFFQNGACAVVGDSCQIVQIIEDKPATMVRQYICKGDSLIVDGKSYDKEGIYNIVIENGVCDSLVMLDLQILNINAEITAERDSFTCNGNKILLEAKSSMVVSGAYSYLWTTANGTIVGDPTFDTVDAVKEGTYVLEIRVQIDDLVCKDTAFKVIFPDQTFPKISFLKNDLNCNQDTAFISATTSLPVSSIVWTSKSGLPFTENGLSIQATKPDVYYLTVQGVNGCFTKDSIEVVSDLNTPNVRFTADEINCKNDSVQILASYDIQNNYQFLWQNVPLAYQNDSSPWVNFGGKYEVIITDINNGCTTLDTVEVKENRVVPIITSFEIDTITCDRSEVTPRLAVNPDKVKYKWEGPSFTSELGNPNFQRSGNYTLTLTDTTNHCSRIFNFEVIKDTIPPDFTITSDSITCLVDSVRLNVLSSNNIKSITWLGPDGFTSKLLSPYTKINGTYQVEVVGQNGCISNSSHVVYNAVSKPEVTIKSDTITCTKDTISFQVTDTKPQFQYAWDGPGLLSNNVVNPKVIAPGTYTLTVTDINTGCTAKFITEVQDSRRNLIPNIVIPTFNCGVDSVLVEFTNPEIDVIIITGDDFISTQKSTYVYKPGNYEYRLTDINGCVTTGIFNVVSNDIIPTLDVEFMPFQCDQDSIMLTAKSDLNNTVFSWEGPDLTGKTGQSIFVQKSGSYTVKGTAPNGCKNELKFDVGYDTLSPVFKILPSDTLTCTRPEIELTTDFVLPGTITWFPSGQISSTLKVIEPGRYIATVRGANNCISTESIEVVSSKILPTFDTISTIINCKEMISRVEIVPLNGFAEITWDNVNNPVSVDANLLKFSTSFPGVYGFEMTNEAGCTSKGTVSVKTDTEKPLVISKFQKDIDCIDPEVEIGVTLSNLGIEYLWNGPDITDLKTDTAVLQISQGGTYYLKITGSNFCVTNVEFEIKEDANAPEYTLFSDTITCDQGKVNIGVISTNTNLIYSWTGPQFFTSTAASPRVIVSGTYLVTITADNGCAKFDSVIVAEDLAIPEVFIQDTILMPCDSTEILLSVASDKPIQRWSWIFPDGSFSNQPTAISKGMGRYSIQIAGENGCLSESTFFDLKISDQFPEYTLQLDTITCKNPEANLKVWSNTPNLEYSWHFPDGSEQLGASILTNLPGGYILKLTDSLKCKASLSFDVLIDTIRPNIEILKNGILQCAEKLVTLDASASSSGAAYFPTWSTNNGNILGSPNSYVIDLDQKGQYIFSLLNTQNGCSKDSIIDIIEQSGSFSILETDVMSPLCTGTATGTISIINMNGTAPYDVIFNNEPKGEQTTFTNLTPGIYKLRVTDAVGCTNEVELEVLPGTDINVTIEKEFLIGFGESLLLAPQLDGDLSDLTQLNWYQKDSLICQNCPSIYVSPSANTVYTLEYTIGASCKKVVSILVRVDRRLVTGIPNVFMPSSTSGNERFYIPQTRGIRKINRLHIFSRWAENVYSITDAAPGISSIGWDGTFAGKEAAQGVYVLIAEFTLADGTIWTYKGDLLLVR